MKISYNEFVDCYKESLGIEGADQLLKQTLKKVNIPQQSDYSKEDALKICRELKKHQGFIGIIAGLIHSRIIIR